MESFGKIGIDIGSIVLYLINFGIIFAVLGWLVFPKILKLIDERRAKIKEDLTTSESLKQQLEQELANAREREEALRTEVDLKISEMSVEAKKAKEAMIREMEQERESMLTETRELIAAQKKQVLADSKAEIAAVMTKVVNSFLSDHIKPQDIDKGLTEALQAIEKG